MFTQRVKSPSDEVWHVGLVIIPSRKGKGLRERFTRKSRDPNKTHPLDFIDVPIDALDEIWVLVAFIVFAVFMVLVGWPMILVLFDLFWLSAVIAGAIISFGILQRPITVRAYSKNKTYTWKKKGFKNALTFKKQIAKKLTQGKKP